MTDHAMNSDEPVMARSGSRRRPSTLAHALLGLLAREPLTGFALTEVVRGRLGTIWSASHSQIYPELARLEGDGLIVHVVVPHHAKTDAKRYSITEEGLEALRSWLRTPDAASQVRDELLLKAYSSWLVDPAHVVALIEQHRGEHAVKRDLYRAYLADIALPAWTDSGADVRTPRFGEIALLRWAESYEDHYTQWCDWLVQEFRV